MSSENKGLMNLLALMGAENVEFHEKEGYDNIITFTFKNYKATIEGDWHNDGTGGIVSYVENV